MKKRSEPKGAGPKTDEGMRRVCEIELARVGGGAGNAAIDFAVKQPV